MSRYFDVPQGSFGYMPSRATKNSAGYDLKSIEDVTIKPNETRLIKTGVSVKMEDDDVMLVCSRSGLALKHSVFVLNACGIVDADYFPNAVGVILHNAGTEDFEVKQEDRIAQGVFVKYLKVDNDKHEHKTERTGGFGSTGGITFGEDNE